MSSTGCARGLATLTLCALPALLTVPAAGAAADYNYLEGGLLYRDDYHDDGVGGRVAGSFNVIPHVAVFGEFDGTNNLDQFDVGAVFHTPVQHDLDFFAGGSLEHGDLHHNTDTGVGGRVGLRWRANSALELDPEFRLVHLYDDDQASVRLNALYRVAPHLDLQGAVQAGDETRLEVGLRFNFASAP